MKKLILLILCTVFAFGVEQQSFLEPEDAFKTKFTQNEDSINIQIELGKDIYLYDDKLKVELTKPIKEDITSKLQMPEPETYDEFIVHFYKFSVDVPFSLLKQVADSNSYELTMHFQGCSKAGLCYAPMSETKSFDIGEASSSVSEEKPPVVNQAGQGVNETDTIASTLKDGNFFFILATFFGFGLLLSLTPCVFPMIPILSSIIVKAGNQEQLDAKKGFFLSLVYVVSMSLAYTLAGILAGIFGANLQVALQNPYVLVAFALIFVALAFSMFGYFKLELPQSIQNKINKTTDGKEKQGVLGIAIMGFLSALIVGPCVAPPLAGALVYIGQTGDAVLGGLALFVMSMGMGVPLLLIGLGAGKYMPKPGGWMETVTKLFGIVMLAIAVWMLDRVLDPTLIMYLWAFLLIGAALYLKIYEHILVRLITTVIFIYGVLVFVGAVSGATNVLKPLESFTAPKGMISQSSQLQFKKIKNIQELEEAIKASTKPVMLDFWAEWCVACKELEEITFKDEAVINKLSQFTLLKADVTDNSQEDKELMKKYGIFGPPGLVFWDENNQEVKASKIIGYKNPKEFLEIVNNNFD